jgi:formamidopyrimidine-DNA glycosylase
MPELPEVETMCRGIAAVVGRAIARVERPKCKKRPITMSPAFGRLRVRMEGHTVERIERLGKRVVLHLDNRDALVIEPRMTGLVLLADPPTVEHLRLKIVLEGHGPSALLFWDRRGLGTVRLYSPVELQGLLDGSRLGPDALAVTAEMLSQRLARSARAIKVALLDQKALAGVGNLYASEMLHLAKIDPMARACDLTVTQWQRLHKALRQVLLKAIRYEGSTLADGTYRNALNKSGGYQNHHRVYDRADEPCFTCGRAKIVRIVQAQRSTFFCPQCQI